MKIATYNIWHSNIGMPKRISQIIKEIELIDADIIALQEVTEEVWRQILASINPSYYIFKMYDGDDEGLAFLSKYSIEESVFLNCLNEGNTDALYVAFNINGKRVSFSNFHLTWNSARKRETEITNLEDFLKKIYEKDYLQFSLGDMNCSENSSVYRFLVGEQSLCDMECNPYWVDVGKVYGLYEHTFNEQYTVDYINNPRWKKEPIFSVSCSMDKIFVRYTNLKLKVINGFLFGKEINNENKLSASDHYGVCFELEF